MSQFDESKIRRDEDGKFASKGPSSEASDVQLSDPSRANVIEAEHYGANRTGLRREKIVQDMADEMVASKQGDIAAAIKGIDDGGFGVMNGAMREYHRRGGVNAESIGAVSGALREELVDRYQAQQNSTPAPASQPDEPEAVEDMYSFSKKRARKAAPAQPAVQVDHIVSLSDVSQKSAALPDPAEPDEGGPYGDGRLSPAVEPEMRQNRRGVWAVNNAQVFEDPSETRGISRLKILPNGDPAMRARNKAAIEMMRDIDGGSIDNKVEQLCDNGSQMTVLTVNDGGTVMCYEGRGSYYQGRPFLDAKGQRNAGYPIGEMRIGAVARGYGKQEELAKQWSETMSRTIPATESIKDFDDVPPSDTSEGYSAPGKTVEAVYLVDAADPGGRGTVPGAMFMATDRMPGAGGEHGDIVNGYLWAPEKRTGALTGEYSSYYANDLKNRAAKVSDYQPGSIASDDCWRGMPKDAGEAYRKVSGADFYQD